MRVTSGRGVDVVSNSPSGELLHASWDCVAKYGKTLEFGKRDILESGQLALNPFLGNRTFHEIDLKGLYRDKPDDIQGLITRVIQPCEQGFLKPITPIHFLAATQRADAFCFMKKGQHIGKIVINMPQESAEIKSTLVVQRTSFSNSSTYMMIGGFVGIRRAVAGNMGDENDVKRAVAAAPTPIAGVLQMSMELRDRNILRISFEDWQAATLPKVAGTWNLHNALLDADLDFFILLGSISGAIGHPGQANYASANTFMSSFVQYRHGLGLPCLIS
ncbi:thiolase-like protein [Pochonia chlamydosporia 170]|uniref:Thiolase-like protein n=1 Tax=Pochonia chlamydosporia 170 TaxID=1380566 RepID=A0A179G3I8_METCM|nr:thiolase-like protein [Pochonia chlamydosporia 170]OAQ71933.1 thiolase-like protein [Pochonia chlamydosporia 170]